MGFEQISITSRSRKITTNLWLIDVMVDMSLVFVLRNICPPSRHKFYVVDIPFFAFEFEVPIDSEKENI
jgi:hypothetical protein